MAIFKKSSPRKSEMKIIPDSQDGTLPYVESKKNDGDEFQELRSESHDKLDCEESGAKSSICEDRQSENPVGEEGQLALDVFQTAEEIVVVAPVAGVKSSDLSIKVSDEVLTIQGRRDFQFKTEPDDYFTRECFWGTFSRSIILPESVDASSIRASFKNGILTVKIPKVEKIRTRMVKIKEE